jgi:MSHA biogenesis protein MshO
MTIKGFVVIKGFTLIELVITATLSAILATVVSIFIARPIVSYSNTTSRAELVDAADMALRRMARDIQRAVPNSLRVKTDPNNSNRIAVEMLNIVEGMRYRAGPPGPFLDFTKANTQFNVIGQFQFATSNPTCLNNGCRIVVYNTGANLGGSDNPTPGANVYSTVSAPACTGGCIPAPGTVTITPVGTTVALANPSAEGQINISPGVQFALASARQRLYVVDTPVTYLCDASLGVQQITRYWGYPIAQQQPTDPTLFPLTAGNSAELTKDINSCNFTYSSGTAQRNGIITMTISLSKNGETITLMREVSVSNVP